MTHLMIAWHRLLGELYAFQMRRRGIHVAPTARIMGKPLLNLTRGSRITVGERARIVSHPHRNKLGVNHPVAVATLTPTAEIILGNHVGISGGSLTAAHLIEIGDGSLLGANVTVMDTNFHPIHHAWRCLEDIPPARERDAVIIGKNVFIGTNAIILKGTRIGDNSVVGAGAVVHGKFPASCIIIGNPARVIGEVTLQD